MNNFEVIRILGWMGENTKYVSICTEIYYIKKGLTIDKNGL